MTGQTINRKNLTKFRPLGMRVPLRQAATDGIFDMTSKTIDRVKSSLYVLLFTAPGTRVMMPEFGSPIANLQFEQVSDRDFDKIKSDIVKAVARWVPEALVSNIEIRQDQQEPNLIEISIRFALTANPSIEESITITAQDAR